MAHNLSMSFSSGIVVLLAGGCIFAACLDEAGTIPSSSSSSSSSSGSESSSSSSGVASSSSGTGGGASSSSSGTGGGASSSSSGSGGMAGAGGAGGGTSSSSSSSGGPLGKPCATHTDCASGFCVDDVCCDTACGDECHRCDSAGSPGTCTPLNVGKDDCAKAGELCNDKQTCACGVSVPPQQGTCPVDWQPGMSPGSCVRKCDTQDACKDGTTTCPAGFDCIVECSGEASCSGTAVIQCPDNHTCTVICSGKDACKGNNVKIQCSADGPCTMDCKNSAMGTCDGGPDLVCGANACTATCEMGAGKPTLDPNNSCNPNGC